MRNAATRVFSAVAALCAAALSWTGPGSAIPGYVDQETVTVRQP
jgi:hypothetical protein